MNVESNVHAILKTISISHLHRGTGVRFIFDWIIIIDYSIHVFIIAQWFEKRKYSNYIMRCLPLREQNWNRFSIILIYKTIWSVCVCVCVSNICYVHRHMKYTHIYYMSNSIVVDVWLVSVRMNCKIKTNQKKSKITKPKMKNKK